MKFSILELDRAQRSAGFTSKRLAEVTGMSPATISAARQRGSAQKITLLRICEALGVPLEAITQTKSEGQA